MKVNLKNPISTSDDHSWHTLAKQAISLSFNDKGELDLSKAHNYSSSKLLFDKSIKTCNQAWPFLKYADLCEDIQTKINLYEQSIFVEKTDFALIKLVHSNVIIDNLEDAKKWLNELMLFSPENIYIKKFSFLEEYERPIEIPIVKCYLNEIVLFTQYYACDEETKNNLIYCLNKNIDNNLINKIVIFYDQEELINELFVISRISKKISIVKIDKRLTFKEWLDFSKKNYPKSIKVLANSDICFDSTLSFLYKLEYRKDILYSSSRLDLSTDDKLVRSLTGHGSNSSFINNFTSQDCWVFRDELIDFEADFVLGSENYSKLLRNSCTSSGCNFLNIFKHINCIHVNRNVKTKNLQVTNENRSGVHVFPFEPTTLEDVKRRQNFAIESYLKNVIPEIKLCSFGKKDLKIENIRHFNINDINSDEVKCDRDYYYLGDILQNALNETQENDYIIYTNSDCYIKEKFYDFILSSNYDCIEFFRTETTNDIIVGQNKDGIDGFAIKNYLLKRIIDDQLLPKNLILGAPYWDAIFSSILRKYASNSYQDTTRLYHIKHDPRWSFNSLDYAGNHNLCILNKLYEDKIINCRKAEIKSDSLVVRMFDGKTDYNKVKNIIVGERFGENKITEFEYNYLFIEKKEKGQERRLNDNAIGTTAGTRYFVEESEIDIVLKYEKNKYRQFVMLGNDESLSVSTEFRSCEKPRLGIVLCFFGSDDLRIKAAQRALNEFKKQTIWKKSEVVFVELVDDESSNFDFSSQENVIHLKIAQKKSNQNLFQKECLWNIGAKKIINNVDNFIFIDADTFPQDQNLFAKANKILHHNPNIVFQLGNCIITQREDGMVSRVQWLWNSFAKLKAGDYCFNPCGGFAISKKIFEEINGFNPYGLLYGGDILFLYEIDERTHSVWNWIINNLKIFKDVPRKLNNKHIVIKNEESPLIHCWHGSHQDRPYHTWGLVFNELEFNKNEIMIDEDGLLSWLNKSTQEKYFKFFKNKNRITDLKIHRELYI